MNHAAALHLLELANYARDLAGELQDGSLDDEGDVVFRNEIEHLMTHLALAWHYAHMSDEQIKELSPKQWNTLTLSLPKLNLDQRLVEPYDPVF